MVYSFFLLFIIKKNADKFPKTTRLRSKDAKHE